MSLPTELPLKASGGKTIPIPTIGYGTWQASEGSWCKDSVLTALKAGYRHLDCAWMYGVNAEIGEAIRESGVPRKDIFITSKFWPNFAAPENVELCIDICLKEMGLDYIDLWLAHWPYASKPTSRAALEKAVGGSTRSNDEKAIQYEDGKAVIDWEHCASRIAKANGKQGSFAPTWAAMEALVKKGKAKTIGVSNFSITDIKDLLPHVKEAPISCNQVEVHPWLPQNELVQFGKDNGIITACYSPFAGQKNDGATLLKDPAVVKLAEKNKMDVGQLLQSWAVQRGTVPLGKSATPHRIESNLKIRKLSDEDMQALSSMGLPDEEGRTVNAPGGPNLLIYKN